MTHGRLECQPLYSKTKANSQYQTTAIYPPPDAWIEKLDYEAQMLAPKLRPPHTTQPPYRKTMPMFQEQMPTPNPSPSTMDLTSESKKSSQTQQTDAPLQAVVFSPHAPERPDIRRGMAARQDATRCNLSSPKLPLSFLFCATGPGTAST